MSALPAPGRPAAFRPPPALRLAAGGIRLLLVEQHAVPLATLTWTARAGALYEPDGLAGLAALTAVLLKQGSHRRPAAAFADAADELGTEVLTIADWDLAYAAIEVLPEDLAAGVDLLAELVTEPAFPEPALAATRGRQRAEAELRRATPASLADDELARAIYGDAPYGRPRLGDAASLARLGRHEVAGFHRRHWRAADGLLVAVGDFDADDLARRAAAAFPGVAVHGAPPAAPSPVAAAPPASTGPRVVVVDVPGAAQTELRVGLAGVPRTDPDFDRLEVLSAILGGAFGSRLNLALREELGHAYRVDSRFAARGGPGPFMVSTAVASDHAGAAARRILAEMARLQREEVPAAEIAAARARVAGSLPRRFESLHGICTELAALEMYALPQEHHRFALARAFAVDGLALLDLAHRHLQIDNVVIVACGPAASLKSQLAGLESESEIRDRASVGNLSAAPSSHDERR